MHVVRSSRNCHKWTGEHRKRKRPPSSPLPQNRVMRCRMTRTRNTRHDIITAYWRANIPLVGRHSLAAVTIRSSHLQADFSGFQWIPVPSTDQKAGHVRPRLTEPTVPTSLANLSVSPPPRFSPPHPSHSQTSTSQRPTPSTRQPSPLDRFPFAHFQRPTPSRPIPETQDPIKAVYESIER